MDKMADGVDDPKGCHQRIRAVADARVRSDFHSPLYGVADKLPINCR
jgi:hypothetical protein